MPLNTTFRRLRKEISSIGVFSVATGATLSAGLFLLPGLAARQAGPAVVLCYLLAVVPLVPAVFSIVELSTAMPRAGGAYYFLDRALGPMAGTVGGIGTWLALVLKTSFALIGMGAYLALIIPGAELWVMKLIAVGFAVLFGLVNWWGAEKSGAFQTALVSLLILILIAFVLRGSGAANPAHFHGFFAAGAESIFATAGLVYISYVGVTKVASISEEVKNPERNLPLGMFVSLATVVVLYALCVYVIVGVLPMKHLIASLTPMADAAEIIAGRTGEVIVTVAALLAFASVANSGIFSASRYPLAMARDHLLPTFFRHLHQRGTPTVGIAVTVAAILFFLLVLDPIGIAKLASTFQLLMFGFLCLAVMVMRESGIESYDPGSPSPFYPWMQIFGVIAPVLLIGVMGWLSILFSTGLITLGLIWYFSYARHRVVRHGAVFHVFERLGRERFDELDIELRGILKEKGLRKHDPFDEVVARATVLDVGRRVGYDQVVAIASRAFAGRLSCSEEKLIRGFTEGTRTGVTPVSEGVALPHMRISGVQEPEMVMVRSRSGLEVETLDPISETRTRAAVHAFFFLVSPEKDPGQHLRLLANLASRVDDPSFLRRWLAARGRDGLKALFLQEDHALSISLVRGERSQALIDQEVRNVRMPEGTLIALIRRPGETIVPSGSTLLREGDLLTVIGGAAGIAAVRHRFLRTGENES